MIDDDDHDDTVIIIIIKMMMSKTMDEWMENDVDMHQIIVLIHMVLLITVIIINPPHKHILTILQSSIHLSIHTPSNQLSKLHVNSYLLTGEAKYEYG